MTVSFTHSIDKNASEKERFIGKKVFLILNNALDCRVSKGYGSCGPLRGYQNVREPRGEVHPT